MLRPEVCPYCRGKSFEAAPVGVRTQQVAQLRERPIEVVEYQQVRCTCTGCGEVVEAALPADVIAGQDLGVSLQAMLTWLGVYGHLSYEKQQEWLLEMGGMLKVPHQTALAAAFIALIEAAFRAHRAWRQTQDRGLYAAWVADFKVQVATALMVFPRPSGGAPGQQSLGTSVALGGDQA